jgi:hypothetical protein
MAEDEVRVLIVGLPALLQELFEKAFAERPRYTLVNSYGLEHLAEGIDAGQPDYVVVPLERDELPQECIELLTERSNVKLVGIEAQGGNARLVRLLPSVSVFEDVAPVELIDRIEGVAASTEREG